MAFNGRKSISELRSDLAGVLGRAGELITPRGVSQTEEYAAEAAEKLTRIRKLTKGAKISSGTTGNYTDSAFQFGSKASRVSGPIDKNVLEHVYGSVDEAFELLQRFEDDYFAAIDEVNKAGGGINRRLIKARGVIDLNVLPKQKADQLMNQFMTNVIKMKTSAGAGVGPTLTSVAGLPGMQVPSASDYTASLFRYVVDQNGGASGPRAYHPMQILLNTLNFSYKQGKAPNESLTVSKTLPSVASIRSVMHDIGDGFKGAVNPPSDVVKSLVFDVETTGVTKGSTVRSLSLAERVVNPDGTVTMNTIMNFSFDSPQLRALREVGVSPTGRSLVQSLADKEGTELIDVGRRGENVVSRLTDVIEMMTDSQYRNIVAHNSQFDIDMLLKTISQQEAFNMDERAMRAVDALYERIDNDPTFVRDTLHKSRIYQLDQANKILDNLLRDPNVSMDDLNKAYVNAIFAEEQLPLIGRKNVGYSSVTNIALNTNLFELMEQDPSAAKVFDTISRGSHIAETDDLLQGYMERYMDEGKLSTWALTQQQGNTQVVKTATGDFLRNIVARSTAVTPTTDVDEVSNLSQFLTTRILSGSQEESIRSLQGTQIRIIGSDAQVQQSLSELGLSTDLGRGVLSVGPDGKIRFSAEAGELGDDLRRATAGDLDQQKALGFIRRTIQNARAGTGPAITATTASGQVLSDNLARQSIVSLGVTVSRNQAIDDMGIAARVPGLAGAPAILGFDRKTQESLDILETGLTAVYRNLGTKANLTSAVQPRAAGVEPPPILAGGMAQYGPKQIADLAESLRAIGDPFYFVDPRSRFTSTYLSSITANAAANATSGVNVSGLTAAQRLLSPMGKKLGTTQGLGLVYSQSVSDDYLRIFDLSPDSKPVPIMSNEFFNLMAERSSADFKGVPIDRKISLVENYQGKIVNLKTMFGQTDGGLTKDHGRALAEQIVETFSSEDSLRKTAMEMGFSARDIDLAFRDSFDEGSSGALKSMYKNFLNMQETMKSRNLNKEQMTAQLAELINEKGVVTERLAGDVYDEVVQLAENLSVQYQNDVEMPMLRKVFDAPEGSASIVYDPEVIDKMGRRADFERATKEAEQAYGEISERLDENRKTAMRGRLLDDISREAGYTRRAVLADSYRRGRTAVREFTSKVPGGPKTLAAAAGAAVLGIMSYRKSEQNELYNQTVEKQPYEPTNYVRAENESLGYLSPANSSRRDPLLTAGVVGNLDRNKINHTRMGNGKYDHLF